MVKTKWPPILFFNILASLDRFIRKGHKRSRLRWAVVAERSNSSNSGIDWTDRPTVSIDGSRPHGGIRVSFRFRPR
jgi:hypothetical protein